jgi:YD repeat-containing protein
VSGIAAAGLVLPPLGGRDRVVRSGRLASYTDGSGSTTRTAYNRYDKPIKVTTPHGVQTFEYNRDLDPRRLPTATTDPVAGTVRATWGPDGQLDRQLLPGGIVLEVTYDPARVPVKRTYWQLDATRTQAIHTTPS